MQHAKGDFVVKVAPVEGTEFEKAHGFARYTLEKTWTGDFIGESFGEMLGANEDSTGAMGYTAVEKMDGELAGKKGTFLFQHSAWMVKGDPKSATMRIEITPKSGTGELAHISGSLTIIIDATGHHYDLAYTLD